MVTTSRHLVSILVIVRGITIPWASKVTITLVGSITFTTSRHLVNAFVTLEVETRNANHAEQA